MATKMNSFEARNILAQCGVEIGADFHALRSSVVEDLLFHARVWKYRRPRNANGSTGRYWHDHLQRVVARAE